MCVILVGKVGEVLKLDLQAAWASNSHGAGVLVSQAGRVQAIKGLMDLADLSSALEALPRSRRVAVHLRYATHGAVTARNTHPFEAGRGAWLMHNGVLSAFGRAGDSGISDSSDLARVLGQIRERADRLKVLRSLSGMYLFADSKGFVLMGSRSWARIGGVLASNTGFLPALSVPVSIGARDWRVDRSLWNWGD